MKNKKNKMKKIIYFIYNQILENQRLTIHPIWNQSMPELLSDKKRGEVIKNLYEKETIRTT